MSDNAGNTMSKGEGGGVKKKAEAATNRQTAMRRSRRNDTKIKTSINTRKNATNEARKREEKEKKSLRELVSEALSVGARTAPIKEGNNEGLVIGKDTATAPGKPAERGRQRQEPQS